MTGSSRVSVIAEVEMLRSARMAAMWTAGAAFAHRAKGPLRAGSFKLDSIGKSVQSSISIDVNSGF